MTDVEKYRIRRARRLAKRGVRTDDEVEEGNNGGNNGGGRRGGGGGHGNTRLPFGLCHRYGIEIGKGWGPSDAWSALADKGVTPAGEFAKRSGGGRTIKTGLATYTNVKTEKFGDKYLVKGDMQPEKGTKGEDGAQIASFTNKKEMFAFLQEKGVSKAVDPDTGEKVNPTKMDLPRTVAKKGEQRFTDLVIGTRFSKSGRAFDKRGFTLVGKDFDGKKVTLGAFETPEKAKEYAHKTLKCRDEDLRRSKDFSKWESKGITPEEDYRSRYKLS